MELNKEHRKQFHEALLSAYPSPGKLEQMISFQLDENLSTLAAGANHSEVVFNLIKWAEAEGRLEELLTAARSENSGNARLRSFEEQIRSKPTKHDVSTSAAVPSEPVNQATKFDVFLAHNSLDKAQVQAICKELKQRGLKPWLDTEQVPPGRWFQDIIQQAIPNVKSAAIFIGLKGLGKWQALELRSFISQCVEADIPVIPILLPGVDKIPEHLFFLKQLNWVRFFHQIDEVEALDNLVWGITGQKP